MTTTTSNIMRWLAAFALAATVTYASYYLLFYLYFVQFWLTISVYIFGHIALAGAYVALGFLTQKTKLNKFVLGASCILPPLVLTYMINILGTEEGYKGHWALAGISFFAFILFYVGIRLVKQESIPKN